MTLTRTSPRAVFAQRPSRRRTHCNSNSLRARARRWHVMPRAERTRVACPTRRSGLFEAVLLDALLVAVILVRQELAGHGDLDAVALRVGQALDLDVEVDGRHDAVAELLLDQGFPGRT